MKYIIVLTALLISFNTLAGDGHDHGESAFAGSGGYLGSFELSDSTIRNLDIQTAPVSLIPLHQTIKIPCIIKNPPEQSSLISVNYMSRVEDIHVSLGDKVEKGQTLFTVFSYIAVRNIEIKSPIDGIVSAQNVKVGQIIQQDMNIAEISTMKYFYAEGMAYLSDDISHISIGDKAKIKIEGTHQDVNGTIKNFSPIVNPENKTKSVLAYFESNDDHIFPNMHCQMTISMGEPAQALAIPNKAILGEFGHHFVFLKHDNHFDRREIVTGLANDEMTEVKSGLREGDSVVTRGNYQLQFVKAGDSSQPHNEPAEDTHND